jgi:hypothetical protein
MTVIIGKILTKDNEKVTSCMSSLLPRWDRYAVVPRLSDIPFGKSPINWMTQSATAISSATFSPAPDPDLNKR